MTFDKIGRGLKDITSHGQIYFKHASHGTLLGFYYKICNIATKN